MGRSFKKIPNLDAPHERIEMAAHSSAKAVLTVLKFGGFWNFAEQAGLNHQTSAALLYKSTPHHNFKKTFAKALECLMSRYQEMKDKLTPGERAFVKEWLKDWSERVAAKQLRTVDPNRPIKAKKPEASLRRRKAVMKEIDALVHSWEFAFEDEKKKKDPSPAKEPSAPEEIVTETPFDPDQEQQPQ